MHETSTVPQAPTELAERRCWRCLQMFPGDAARPVAPHEDFWLCGPCAAALLPSKHQPS